MRTYAVPGKLTFGFIYPKDATFGELEETLLRAYVPGIQLMSATDHTPDLIMRVSSEVSEVINKSKECILPQISKGGLPFASYLATYSRLRSLWIERGIYSCHAAAVKTTRGVILLTGPSGSGKSTVSLALHRTFGIEIYSGNKTLLSFGDSGKAFAEGGTNVHTLRIADYGQFSDVLPVSFPYLGRVACPFESSPLVLPVIGVIFVKLGSHGNKLSKCESDAMIHRLYPLALDVVNQDTVVHGTVIESSTPPVCKKRLVQGLTAIHPGVFAFDIQGDLDFVLQSVCKLVAPDGEVFI